MFLLFSAPRVSLITSFLTSSMNRSFDLKGKPAKILIRYLAGPLFDTQRWIGF